MSIQATYRDGDRLGRVEDGVLPVRIPCVRASTELNRLVAGGEGDVEPSDEGVHDCADQLVLDTREIN